jgi:hypothetical protein
MFLNGNFVALSHFQERYGIQVSDHGVEPIVYAIETKWQSSLFQAGQCGAFVGVFMAGPITNILGYRWTTLLGLVLMNATIFISFFVSRLMSIKKNSFANSKLPGRLTRGPGHRTSLRGCPLGILYSKCPGLRVRGCASSAS